MDEFKKCIILLMCYIWNLINLTNSYQNQVLITSLITTTKRISYCNQTFISKLVHDVLNDNDKETRKHLRISSRVFKRINTFLPKKRHGWENEHELVVFLFWLASGASYRVVSCSTNTPKTTVHDIVHKLLNFTVEKMMPAIIKFPDSADFEEIGNKFNRRAKSHIFDKAIGAIDGTHIRIQCPVKLHDQYVNRKCTYSVQCQAVCDSSMRFINVFAGFPGSVHDSRVLYNSSLYKDAKYPPPGYYLLGDSGYSNRKYPITIVTPFKETGNRLTTDEKKFNHIHSKARSIVECGFGQVKSRWRCIFNIDLELKIETTVKTIVSCFVFHNICVSMGDFELIDFNIDDNDDNDFERIDDREGNEFRQWLLNRMITNE